MTAIPSKSTIVSGEYEPSGKGELYIDRKKFNEAIFKGVFPELNGLLGLINNINYWATFNSFSRGIQSGEGVRGGTWTSEQEMIDNIYKYTDGDQGLEDVEEQQRLDEYGNATQVARDQGYGSIPTRSYLRALAEYQSANFSHLMRGKLSLPSEEALRNYIIPRGDKLSQCYIRWDALCVLLTSYLIPSTPKGPPIHIVSDRVYDTGNSGISKIDPLLYVPIAKYTNTTSNTIYDFSCDANICILPHQFGEEQEVGITLDTLHLEDIFGYTPNLSVFPQNYILSTYNKHKSISYNGEVVSLPTSKNTSTSHGSGLLKSSDRSRRIGSIFININMLVNIAEKNEDNEKYTLGNFINDIWEEINKACPNHNFVLTDDKESNNIFIIDLPVDNTSLPMEFHEFEPFSNKNILRKFDYTSNVPSAMTATIAVQAQDPGSIRDIDGVTFAAFNRSIKNRIFNKDIISDFEKTKEDIKNKQSQMEVAQSKLGKMLKEYQINFFKNVKNADTDKLTIGGGNPMGMLKEYQKNSSYMSLSFTNTNSFNSVIPLEFSATLDGISGMVIGNIFKVQKDRLPKAYHKSNIGFILFNEEQKITAGGDWTTDISGKMTILPDEKNRPKITGISVKIPSDIKIAIAPEISPDSTTKTLLDGQGDESDILEAGLDDFVYLKSMKDNSPTRPARIGPTPTLFFGWDEVKDSIGFAWVRNEPTIDNEHWSDGTFSDTSLGSFNTWGESYGGNENWAGMPLGKIVSVIPDAPGYIKAPHIDYPEGTGHAIVNYEDNRISINEGDRDSYLPAGMGYGNQTPTFTYDEASTSYINRSIKDETQHIWAILIDPQTKNPTAYSNVSGNEILEDVPTSTLDSTRTTINLLKSHCNTQNHLFVCIEFSKEASEKFNKGWVLGDFQDGTNYIDTNGADNDMDGMDLAEYSKNNNVWMHYSTIAKTKSSALKTLVRDSSDRELIPPETD